MSGEPALFVAFLAVGIPVSAFLAYLERRRGQALRAACARRGWSYRAEGCSLVGRWGARPGTTRTYSVTALGLPVPLPSMTVEPEGWLSHSTRS